MSDRCPCCHAPRPLIAAGWGFYLCPDCRNDHEQLRRLKEDA